MFPPTSDIRQIARGFREANVRVYASFTMSGPLSGMRLSPLLIAVLISACASPSPRFFGAERRDVTVEGSRFAVFQRADEVEVHRISREFLPKESTVLTRAIRAIEQATGCPVRPRSMKGDQAVITAEIDCPV